MVLQPGTTHKVAKGSTDCKRAKRAIYAVEIDQIESKL